MQEPIRAFSESALGGARPSGASPGAQQVGAGLGARRARAPAGGAAAAARKSQKRNARAWEGRRGKHEGAGRVRMAAGGTVGSDAPTRANCLSSACVLCVAECCMPCPRVAGAGRQRGRSALWRPKGNRWVVQFSSECENTARLYMSDGGQNNPVGAADAELPLRHTHAGVGQSARPAQQCMRGALLPRAAPSPLAGP